MRILSINTTDIRGGAGSVAYQLKKGMESRGHYVSMFVSQKDTDDENIYVINKKGSFGQKIKKRWSYYFANDIDFYNSDSIIKTKEFEKADLIHCHNLHGYYFNLNTLYKISSIKPLVWTFHDMWPITSHCAHSFDGKIENGFFQCPNLNIYPPIAWHNERYLERKKEIIYNKSNFTIVTPSDWLKEKVEISVLKEKPLYVIKNGVNIKLFNKQDKTECRKKLNLPQDKFIFLAVIKKGKLNPWKGGIFWERIVNEYNKNDKLFFIQVGGGFEQTENSISIPFLKNEEQISEYYSAADCLFYPSLADNCPLTVIEAQACGLPVISYNTGGIPEIIIDKKTGFIAKYKDYEDLKNKALIMVNMNKDIFKNFELESIKRINQLFTTDIMVSNYEKLFLNIVHSFE